MLSIPIISEFDGKGVSKAIKQFKQLETVGEKAQFAIKKAAIPAAAALGAVTAALGAAVAAAAEDEAQAAQLALTLNNVTGATEKQVKATEDMISAMSRATGTADSELRPALATLVTGTKDIATATDALTLAQDIAIGSNKSLGEVSEALARAYGGNMKGLQALSPEMKAMIKDGASLDEVMQVLSGTFGGAAATAADTAAGRFKILKNSLDETKESIGAALLPAVQKVLPFLQAFADWAQKNPGAFLVIAGTISTLALAIMAVNFAMAANPFTLIATGIAVVVTGLAIAYTKFEGFRNIVNSVFNGIMATMEVFVNAFNTVLNSIIYAYNLVNPFSDIPSLSTNLVLPRAGGGSSSGIIAPPNPPKSGGTMPGVSMPPMPSPTAPMGGGGGGGSRSQGPSFSGGGGNSFDTQGQLGSFDLNLPANFTINVSGGISTSAEIGKSVVDAINQYTQVYGPVRFATA